MRMHINHHVVLGLLCVGVAAADEAITVGNIVSEGTELPVWAALLLAGFVMVVLLLVTFVTCCFCCTRTKPAVEEDDVEVDVDLEPAEHGRQSGHRRKKHRRKHKRKPKRSKEHRKTHVSEIVRKALDNKLLKTTKTKINDEAKKNKPGPTQTDVRAITSTNPQHEYVPTFKDGSTPKPPIRSQFTVVNDYKPQPNQPKPFDKLPKIYVKDYMTLQQAQCSTNTNTLTSQQSTDAGGGSSSSDDNAGVSASETTNQTTCCTDTTTKYEFASDPPQQN